MDANERNEAMSETLIPRVTIALPTGLKEIVPAYVIRGGLAIHVAPWNAGDVPLWWAVSAIGCGYRLGLFDRVDNAEKALVALAPLAEWESVRPEDVQHLREKVTQIIAGCGDVRHRTACE